MKRLLIDRIPFSKITLILAVITILSLGSCGIGMAVSDGGNRPGFVGGLGQIVLYAGAVGFWLSILSLILLGVAYVVLSIAKHIAPGSSESD
jgi:hypothetical protein